MRDRKLISCRGADRNWSWSLRMTLMCDYTVEMVGDLGYSVLSAPDGASALRLLDSHRQVSLLFTDVGLPGGMNGRQLAEQALRRQPQLKVLYTTGYARNAIINQG